MKLTKSLAIGICITILLSVVAFAASSISSEIKKKEAKESEVQLTSKTPDTNKGLSKEKIIELYNQGYGIQDIEKAEELSNSSGKSVEELLKEKGKPYEKKSWQTVIKKFNINTTKPLDTNTINEAEKIGLTSEQITELKNIGMDSSEIIQAALICKNYNKKFQEIIDQLNSGKSTAELNAKYSNEYINSSEYKEKIKAIDIEKQNYFKKILDQKYGITNNELEKYKNEGLTFEDIQTAADISEKYKADIKHTLELRKSNKNWKEIENELGGEGR